MRRADFDLVYCVAPNITKVIKAVKQQEINPNPANVQPAIAMKLMMFRVVDGVDILNNRLISIVGLILAQSGGCDFSARYPQSSMSTSPAFFFLRESTNKSIAPVKAITTPKDIGSTKYKKNLTSMIYSP